MRECLETLTHAERSSEVAYLLEVHGLAWDNLPGIAARVGEFPELVTLPEGYEEMLSPPSSNSYYIGAELDTDRGEERFDWSRAASSGRIIYCSLGSQTHRDVAKSTSFFTNVLDCATSLDDIFLIMSVGKDKDASTFRSPGNCLVVSWAPQLEILSKASMMIMHGGMGTTRECILHGVPMLVEPLMRDQFASAEAICRHGLGMRAYAESSSRRELGSKIKTVLENRFFRDNVAAMQQRFLKAEKEHAGVHAVEALLRR